jgi:uncharacterized protein (UPF0332 family)
MAQVRDLWKRAEDTLTVAERDVRDGFPDCAASRAYYAAFHAASALLLAVGKRPSKHREVIAAIHRDYVREGKLPREAGEIITTLHQQRDIADYGGSEHVAPAEAETAVADARRFLAMVRPLLPAEPADSPPL